MRTIYIKVEKNGVLRKISLDMAYLYAHKQIRLPKYYFEDGLFLDYKELGNSSDLNKLFLTRDKIKKEDSDFYYFEFPVKLAQVFDIAV